MPSPDFYATKGDAGLGRADADLPSIQSKFAARLHDLEEKLAAVSKSEEATTKAINDTFQKLTNVLKNQKLTREMIEEKKNKEVRAAEGTLNLEVG